MVFTTYLGQNHSPFRDCETLSERLHTDDLLSREASMDVYLISQRIVTGDVFYSRKVDIAPKLSVHPGEEVTRSLTSSSSVSFLLFANPEKGDPNPGMFMLLSYFFSGFRPTATPN